MSTRVCPVCRQGTDEPRCPKDGFHTVPASRVSDTGTSSLVGCVFHGRFRIEAMIGRGGMGMVFRATQLSMNRPVAVKVLRPGADSASENVLRFEAEARAVSQLDHPNIVRVFDYGRDEAGRLFLVTELLKGETVGAALKRGRRFAPAEVVDIVEQLLLALQHAHARGMVHRDIKADNIFLTTYEGRADFVKVLDFGLAKAFQGDDALVSITRSGTVVGTAAYMSPEQALGKLVSPASDLYSVGILMFEMLTGQRPFRADHLAELLIQQVKTPAPPLPAQEGWPMLPVVVERLLVKTPEDRYATAADVLEELRAEPSEGSALVSPLTWAILVGALLGLSILAYALTGRG